MRAWKNILIVLGCAPNPNNTPCQFMRERVAKAIILYNKNRYDAVIFSGGPNKTKIPESEMMRALALSHIPQNRMFVENKSKSTIQNAVFTWDMLKGKKIKKITILTSEFHITRSRFIFRNLYQHMGTKLIFVGAKHDMGPIEKLRRATREKIALIQLKVWGIK